jgi:Tol biopolymer transport system component
MISFVDEYTRSLNSDSSYGYQINVVSVADLKLTTLEVYGNDPIISPDNKMIAFEIYVQYPSIRVMNLDGSNINILVTNFQNLQGWTADSKKVIFTINDIYYAKDISGNNDPVEIDNPDLPVKVIYLSDYTRDPRSIVTADSLVMNSGLSPDRSKGFVVWRIRTTLPGLPFPILSKFGLMFLYDFNSLQETLLADEVQSLLDVSWSPDGRQIAFVDSSGINVINANGSYRKEIVPFIDGSQDFNQLSLRWSPK